MRLVSLDTAIWLSILAETVVLSWLVVLAAGARRALGAARGLSTLVTGLVGVNLALGKLWWMC